MIGDYMIGCMIGGYMIGCMISCFMIFVTVHRSFVGVGSSHRAQASSLVKWPPDLARFVPTGWL